MVTMMSWPVLVPVRHHGDGSRPVQRHPGLSAFLHQVVLVTAAMVAYFGIRNLTAGSAQTAFANAERLLRLERTLRIAWENTGQAAIIGRENLVTLLNWIYIWGHWPVILTAAICLYLLRRRDYYVLRDAMFISGGIGFLLFALLPVAPPRLLGLGLIDTVTQQSHAYRTLQPPGLTNQYAAFPSLHLLLGIVLFQASKRLAVRLFAVCSPLAMATAVVLTANHFVVDVIAGAGVVLISLWLSRRLHPKPVPLAPAQLP
jgi:hypothetical protein